MVWGVSAAVHAEPGSALSAVAEEEFRPPAVVVASSRPADAAGGPATQNSLLPRRRPVTALAGGRRRAVVALAEPPGEAAESGAIVSWPDLNLLAQVLRGLQRMAWGRPGRSQLF